MNDTESWLYNNHEETLNKATIEDIYKKTVAPGQKIYNRKSEWEGLEDALNFLKNGINTNINRYEGQLYLSKEGKSLLNDKELEEISQQIQFYNDIYNKTFENTKNLQRFIDCPVSPTSISKSGGELEDKINRVFVEAEKREKLGENKNVVNKDKPDGDSKTGPNISSSEKEPQMDLD